MLQFYPENDAQVELIVSQALRSGFTGGLVVDFPNSTRVSVCSVGYYIVQIYFIALKIADFFCIQAVRLFSLLTPYSKKLFYLTN